MGAHDNTTPRQPGDRQIDPHDIANRIAALCRDLRDIPPVRMTQISKLASDILSDTPDDTPAGFSPRADLDASLLDGMLWGHHAAWQVERQGGALLRLRAPGKSDVTHQYALAPRGADLDAALRAVQDVLDTMLTPGRAAR